ncbi:MAG: DUF998 domain-containing protein [Nitrososphaeria archaeon]
MSRVCLLGPLALIIAWATIVVSIMVNPWFNLFKGALSDLGALGLGTNYIFNTGLILTGIVFAIYAGFLGRVSKNRVSAMASGVAILAAAHLIMIAVFPSGTEPHRFVSLEFFLLAAATIFFMSISFYADGEKFYGTSSTIIFLAGILGSALIEWPSTALLEIYDIMLLTIWTILVSYYCMRKEC